MPSHFLFRNFNMASHCLLRSFNAKPFPASYFQYGKLFMRESGNIDTFAAIFYPVPELGQENWPICSSVHRRCLVLPVSRRFNRNRCGVTGEGQATRFLRGKPAITQRVRTGLGSDF
jgi:hypothetical protein